MQEGQGLNRRRLLTILSCTAVFLTGCGEDVDPLVERLREGGHTLVVRHATADAEIARQEDPDDCLVQRNLTEAGRAQATAIGRAVRELEIPIGDVRTSPLCRARDTARLAFRRATDDEDLISPGVIGTEADDERRAQVLRAAVENPADGERNVVLVTHTGNIGAGLGEETVAEGETLVYARDGRLAGRITAERWTELAEGG